MATLPGLPEIRFTGSSIGITFGGGGIFGGGRAFGFTSSDPGSGPEGWTVAASIVQAVVDLIKQGVRSGLNLGSFPTPESDYIAQQIRNAGLEVPAELTNTSPPAAATAPPQTTPLPQQSPYVPSRPGQMPIGYNPNCPFVFGSAADPGGLIDWRYAFPTPGEVIQKIGLDTPERWIQLLKWGVGQVMERYQRRMQEAMIDAAQRAALVQRQQQLQLLMQWLASLRTPLSEAETRDIALQYGIDLTPPVDPACCTKETRCPTDSH